MLKIKRQEVIDAEKAVVWQVLEDLPAYAEWNTFVVACESTLDVGSPIRMRVQILPGLVIPQKETIFQHVRESTLEYGIRIPPGLLSSSRKHLLTATDAGKTVYQSVFELKGLLSPIVKLLLGSRLERGFSEMTQGIVKQSIIIQERQNKEGNG